MFEILLAVDQEDGVLGSYFQECANDIQSAIEDAGLDHNLHIVQSRQLNEIYVGVELDNRNSSRFIFIAFTHGSNEALLAKEVFISTQSNVDKLKNSLTYTFSCSAAALLGQELVNNGCISFFGYNSYAYVVHSHSGLFVECSNFGFKRLIEGATTSESYLDMISKYEEEIDNRYKTEFMVSVYLRKNRDALILRGEQNIRLEDFILQG